MEVEHAVYDPTLTSYTYFIHNDTEQTVDFGEAYGLQHWEDGAWEDLTLRADAGWVTVGYTLKPGSSMALRCDSSLFEETLGVGRYRLVKTVGGQTLYAPFELGESAYTAATPYGFARLEDLPAVYGAAEASGSGAVIYTGGSTEDSEAVGTFLEKVALDAPCQLRTVQDYGEGTPMIIDVIYEDGSFLWRMRSDGQIVEQRLSYIVTDGTDLYLSNGADWDAGERYGDKRIFLVPPLTGAQWTSDVEAMTADRLRESSARYRVWSADGTCSAFLTDTPTAFGVERRAPGAGPDGSLYDLRDWYEEERSITGLSWQEDGTLRLTCAAAEGGALAYDFDPSTGYLTEALCGYPTAG